MYCEIKKIKRNLMYAKTRKGFVVKERGDAKWPVNSDPNALDQNFPKLLVDLPGGDESGPAPQPYAQVL
jgi:hypothetical protein